MAEIEVREARPEDATELLRCMLATQTETDNLIREASTPLPSVEEQVARIEHDAASPRDAFLVAFLDGELVGTASLTGSTRPRIAHRADIGLSVERRAWGQGVGTALMRRLVETAREWGVETIDLEVRSDNERAIRLYRRFGFTCYARYEGYLKIDGKPVACDLMRLDL